MIGPIGHIVNLNLGALRETPVELWDYETWAEMSAVATCFLDVRTAGSLRIEYKPLTAGAKRIVDKLNAESGGGASGTGAKHPDRRPERRDARRVQATGCGDAGRPPSSGGGCRGGGRRLSRGGRGARPCSAAQKRRT